MNYSVKWDEQSLEDLEKLDYSTAERIVKKIELYLVQDPLQLGKPLSNEYKGLYRYRFGNYRIIYEIDGNEIVIIKIGHRKNIYI
ncbi:MAG: Cytotoxic translational repressor of toxin-antitoxin system RelE [Rickettsiaceae bacterium]|jgi:mRNA interferase RelE/StbE|nr:Cytotoxic translational repressor of toxin-antitoxin system RelE [Rickettsiaceae bacterium]